MPSWIRTQHDENLWAKAKEIVKEQYKLDESDGEKFWASVTGMYKHIGGKIKRLKKKN